MNENLKTALRAMLNLADECPVLFDEIDFKKEGWFRAYHWDIKRQEIFTKWLSDFLKKNWEGITEHKINNKKLRDKASEQFVFNYGCVLK